MSEKHDKPTEAEGGSAKADPKPSREDRLSAALRENLKKRKAAARSRKEQSAGLAAAAGGDQSGSGT